MEEYKKYEVVEGQLKGIKEVTEDKAFDIDANELFNAYSQKITVYNEAVNENNALKKEIEQKEEVLEVNNNKLDEMDSDIEKYVPVLQQLNLISVDEEEEEEAISEE